MLLQHMIKSIIGILIGLIILLFGVIITVWESFGSEAFLTGMLMIAVGLTIICVFIVGKIKSWF